LTLSRSALCALAITALAAASLAGGCMGGDEEAAPTEGATAAATTTTTTTTTAPTTTEPAVEPLSDDERKWVTQIHEIRPRIDKAFHRSLNITRASMRSLIRVLENCTVTLKEAGSASDRFSPAAQAARRACARYNASIHHFQRAIDVSDVSGAVVAGTPQQRIFDRSLDRAFAAQSNASNVMLRAEEKADEIRDEIEAEASP
jgi:hypothetical protein